MILQGMEVKGIVKVDNVRLYGLEESLYAATYPKALEPVDMLNAHGLKWHDEEGYIKIETDENLLRIGTYLGNAKPGSGHDCYLKGITVQFDLCLPEYLWRQLNRYHFIDFVSSQSKMHKILELDIDEQCNKYVSSKVIEHLKSLIKIYNNLEDYKKAHCEIILRDGEKLELTHENVFNLIIANTPCGFMLTARMTTNYLQLKSIIGQRQHHKMQEWIYLTDYFKQLPLMEQLVLKKNK